jgi:RND family efflux transporter MFP subunit
MKLLQQIASIILCVAFAVGVGLAAWWLIVTKPNAPKAEKPPSPAQVAKPVKDEELNTIVLTEEAEKRIGLKLGTAVKKSVRRTRVYGGDVTVPAGKTLLVSAPLGGILKAPEGGMPRAGAFVKKGQPVITLLPLLTPEGRATLAASLVDADGQVKNAQTSVDAAKIALDRAQRLLNQEAGSKRMVDEAQAAFDLATKTLEAATARRTLLARLVGETDSGTATAISLDAPQDGLLRTVSALPGQTVPSGAALFEVVDLNTVWVRVPLPVGELEEIVRTEPAQVGKLAAPTGSSVQAAQPVPAPPSANPLAATVDVFYELPNSDKQLIPGQRLGVTIPLNEAKESLTVPWAAVVFDVHGGAWVYEQTAPRIYVRRRVDVRYVLGADAVLGDGPPVGAKVVLQLEKDSGTKRLAVGATVVAEGGEELFGAETGFSK